MSVHGDKLLSLAREARQTVVLVAPFVKVNALARILDSVPTETPVTVIARWVPIEIAQGVCDLEIYDLLSARANSRLFVHPLLHAKLYRFDENLLVGSANITDRALGWICPANIELLLALPDKLDEMKTLESDLLFSAIKVNQDYRDTMQRQVDAIKVKLGEWVHESEHVMRGSPRNWLPTCPSPDKLWIVYSDGENAQRRMVETAFIAAVNDLEVLSIIPGLEQSQFIKHVVAILECIPIIREIDVAAQAGLTTDAAFLLLEKLAQEAKLSYTPAELWEIMQKWLLYFFPNRYRSETYSTIFRRGSILS